MLVLRLHWVGIDELSCMVFKIEGEMFLVTTRGIQAINVITCYRIAKVDVLFLLMLCLGCWACVILPNTQASQYLL